MCFVWISEQTAIISLHNINWLVCITETESVYCAVRTGYLYTILRSAHTVVFMCFVWIWEQIAIISLYSINWLVFITEMESVYYAVRTGYLYIIITISIIQSVNPQEPGNGSVAEGVLTTCKDLNNGILNDNPDNNNNNNNSEKLLLRIRQQRHVMVHTVRPAKPDRVWF